MIKEPKKVRESHQMKIRLTQNEYQFILRLAKSEGVSCSEYIRLFIQTLKIAEKSAKAIERSIKTGKPASVEIGGYGVEFSGEFIKSFVGSLETQLEQFNNIKDQIVITHPKTPQYRRHTLKTTPLEACG